MSGSQGTPPTHCACTIRTEDLCRHYRLGDTLIRAVDGVSLEVRSGEFVALLGSSGSGKSSVLNLIAGLDRPTSGSVIVQGRNLARLSREELSKYRLHTVGMVFQSFKQRAALARALINRPQLLLADEPTGNLDSRTGTEIMNLVRHLNRQLEMTVVMVTHERALAERYAQRLIFLADGKLIADQANRSAAGEIKSQGERS